MRISPTLLPSQMNGHAGSISPLRSRIVADVGAAWWLLWRPSPPVINASHCRLVAEFGYGRLPNVCPMAFTAELSWM